MKKAGRGLLFFGIMGLLTAGCGGSPQGYDTEQIPWSDMTDANRAQLRTTLSKFNGNGIENIDVLAVLGVVHNEALRVADALSNSAVVELSPFNLLDPKVLPKNDANGFYDSSGGYREFSEVMHDLNGEVISDNKVHQQERRFEAGMLSLFRHSSTLDTPSEDYLGTGVYTHGVLANELSYTESAWHQQKSSKRVNGGTRHDESFVYQSHPRWKTTVQSGSNYTFQSETEDWIYDDKGFTTITVAANDFNLTGTHTRYMPKLVIPATDSKSINCVAPAPACNPRTDGNTTRDSYTEVTPDPDLPEPPPSLVGPDGELEERVVITTTYDTTNTQVPGCICGMCDARDEVTVTETELVTYRVAPGMARQARENRSLENHRDYTVTTRVTNLTTQTCSGDNWTQEESTTTLKYTDNPANRNDIAGAWKSTRSSKTTSYNATTGNTTVVDHGTEWLVDQLEIDPDVNATPWTIVGTEESRVEFDEVYFGDDRDALKQNQIDTHTLDLNYGWSANQAKVAGTIVNRFALIQKAECSGTCRPHIQQGDGDGSLSVTIAGATATVSAEEWLTLR